MPINPDFRDMLSALSTAQARFLVVGAHVVALTVGEGDDGTLDVFNFSYAVERTPRLSYVIGDRCINEIDSNLLGAGLNYKISEKHTFAVREQFDLDRGETAEFSIAFIRKLPRWYLALSFDLDDVDDDFGVSVSAWPEGLPRATLGSRRYTGLAESTGIRPE